MVSISIAACCYSRKADLDNWWSTIESPGPCPRSGRHHWRCFRGERSGTHRTAGQPVPPRSP